MARYSSDSDSDRSGKYRKKHYRRSRSSSSDSSDSSSHRKRSSKYSKSRRRHRSRSRSRDNQRTSTSYKSSPGSSKDRNRHRDNKYKSRKSRSQSPDRNKKKVRSVSREKSTSRSSSSQSYVKTAVDKNTNTVGKDEFTIEPRIKESILEEINADSFTPKQFTSSAHNKDKKSNKNILIDITAENIQMPPIINPPNIQDSIFHSSIIMDHDIRFDKWVKKLYNLRQKAIADVMSIVT
ncbi:hypothetical protein PV327_005833 [Microctonus hyperodae]|uniref:Luc7-like protein 3 n=1 Tax=Microctonus hyperodae TaxID=165561 RepID=A0AA39G271_MICHY|nr:hypothetical protein PV327_005833 [Microctonus hyperodae]